MSFRIHARMAYQDTPPEEARRLPHPAFRCSLSSRCRAGRQEGVDSRATPSSRIKSCEAGCEQARSWLECLHQ